ncbi:hypothetical protein MINTM005_13530 [Mycobacterium intracellulare]|nr:hypothetical protein MINTM005_13530 [Mycobacterium intracellulare]
MGLRQEYACRNPHNGAVLGVPDASQSNAQRMAALVPGSLVMTRYVTDWVVDDPNHGWPGYCQNCKSPLDPPTRTDCPHCGEDDTDYLG